MRVSKWTPLTTLKLILHLIDTITERRPSIDITEKLLRVALFSDSLQLTAVDGRTDSIVRARQELARILRVARKKGVIQVFLSEALFVIALAISIYGAFGEIGNNQTAHELGIGLLLSWLPILVLSSIVDRNPVAADEICRQLNDLIFHVRTALLDTERRGSCTRATGQTQSDFERTKFLEDDSFPDKLFVQFAGQGRVRWHVGDAVCLNKYHSYSKSLPERVREFDPFEHGTCLDRRSRKGLDGRFGSGKDADDLRC